MFVIKWINAAGQAGEVVSLFSDQLKGYRTREAAEKTVAYFQKQQVHTKFIIEEVVEQKGGG
jgi:hypothetical protein